MSELKKCHGCAQKKPLDEFDKKCKSKCVECVRALARKNYAANPTSRQMNRERQTRFRKNNPKKIQEAKNRYKNKEK
jgi:hypothetical protein